MPTLVMRITLNLGGFKEAIGLPETRIPPLSPTEVLTYNNRYGVLHRSYLMPELSCWAAQMQTFAPAKCRMYLLLVTHI
jgi:hypothetical protein